MNPSPKPRIAVDAMGGDFGPHVVIPGALHAARAKQYELLLVGDETRLAAELTKLDTRDVSYRIVHASQVAEMHDKPSDCLRKKKDSSIQVACNLVRNGDADGIISAGNTGVVLASSLFTLGRLEGVDRPALATILPTERSPCVLVDAGANVDCKPLNLMQFGIMADVMARTLLHCPTPKVALLSIGSEEGKGNVLVKEAFDLLKLSSLNFVGNIEGRDLFTGVVDVVVCDGFVGNVAIKLGEGLASSLGRLLKGELRRGFFAKIRHHACPFGSEALLAPHGLRRIRRRAAPGLERHRHRQPRGIQCEGHPQRRGHGWQFRPLECRPTAARWSGRQQGFCPLRQTCGPRRRIKALHTPCTDVSPSKASAARSPNG